MVILQLKKVMVNTSSMNNSPSLSACASTTPNFDSPNGKSSSTFLDSFSSTSMISSNELFKERLDLKKKKQLSLNNYHSSSPTLSVQLSTPTTPTTPHSPSHSSHSPSRVGKQPRSRTQSIGGAPNHLKEKFIEEIPSVFEACFQSEVATSHSTPDSFEKDELKQFHNALLAEYCKLRPVTVQVDREKRTDKPNACSVQMKSIISINLQLPHLNRRNRN